MRTHSKTNNISKNARTAYIALNVIQNTIIHRLFYSLPSFCIIFYAISALRVSQHIFGSETNMNVSICIEKEAGFLYKVIFA